MESELPESENISKLWDQDLYHSIFSENSEPPVPSGSVPHPLTRERSIGDGLDGHDQRDVLANVPIPEHQLYQTTDFSEPSTWYDTLEPNSDGHIFSSDLYSRADREADVSTNIGLQSDWTQRDEEPHVRVTRQEEFQDESSLKMHRLIHTDENSFQCPECPKLFTTKEELNRHLTSHSNVRYSCDYCDKTFTTVSSRNTHVKTIHLKEKSFVCDICEKAFGRIDTMKQHRRTHTGEQPYYCLDCDLKFTHRSGLHNHRRSVHGAEI